MTEQVVRAAGGIVVRDGRVLVVHRPKYDDWSLPKGKLEEGESWAQAAVREVAEETGLRGELGDEVGRTHYLDARGRNKEVRYFRMTPVGEPRPQNEVDEVRWVTPEEAMSLLTHERDRDLVRSLRLGTPPAPER
jgi:8-oxo-dGTP diphosphatase